jgi:hypothetical protein
MRSLRPDGLEVWVRNDKLMTRRPGDAAARRLLAGQARMRFFGSPIWVGKQSGLILATAWHEEGS